MQAKEKFNNIVYKIEELVWEAEYMKAYEISEEAFAAGECYIDDRSKNTLFLFLVGSTVIDYINERRMMAAYKHLITMKKKNFKKVIDLSGVQEHSSFVRKFSVYSVHAKPSARTNCTSLTEDENHPHGDCTILT